LVKLCGDGFALFLNGVRVAFYDANQGPTAREFIGIELQGGMNLLELIYWEQGGNARVKVDVKDSGTSSASWGNFLSLDNSAIFTPGSEPVLAPDQDIAETTAVRLKVEEKQLVV
jgi:hypothetical protein